MCVQRMDGWAALRRRSEGFGLPPPLPAPAVGGGLAAAGDGLGDGDDSGDKTTIVLREGASNGSSCAIALQEVVVVRVPSTYL